ncbi:MAG: hypothetical protein FWF01_00325 [Alphaproteobacteria bacterium]|nr:hypothetical protein [Alphaproteobacteria bacterium]
MEDDLIKKQTAIVLDPRGKQPKTHCPMDEAVRLSWADRDSSDMAARFYQALADVCQKDGGPEMLEAFNKVGGEFIIQMTDGQQPRPYIIISGDRRVWWTDRYDKFKGYYTSYRRFCTATMCSDAINERVIAHEMSHAIDERMAMRDGLVDRPSNGVLFLHCLHADSLAPGHNPARDIIDKLKKEYKSPEFSDFDETEAYAYAVEMFFGPRYRPENSPYLDAYFRRIALPSISGFVCGAYHTTALEKGLRENLNPLPYGSPKALNELDRTLLGKDVPPLRKTIYKQVASHS